MNYSNTTIVHIVGNRPQFIKLALLYDAIAKYTNLNQFIIHTGQHSSKEMSGIFFDELFIPSPNIQLNTDNFTPDEFIGKTAAQICSVLVERNKNDFVFVYGDTNTTLAASLAAKRCSKLLLHFEAGVRTNDASMPEEINRILSDRLAQIHYCCTQNNKDNLIKEGFSSAIPAEVIWSGDLMLDAFQNIAFSNKKITASNRYVACTIHRAANITNKENLSAIINGLNAVHKQIEVIVPLHPHTKKRVEEYKIKPHFTVIEPLAYKEMKRFICEASYVITDSGGASREAFFAKKKSLIVMQHPFWFEIVEAAAALHCSANADAIINSFSLLPALQPNFDDTIFGDGNAALKIAQHLNTIVAE